MNVVVVESPAKAKTINKYLGSGYRVMASYGHIRDLPAKDGSVEPDKNFAMLWEVDAKADKRLKEIAAAVRGAKRLFLATDPDREGEAISWHIFEELGRRRALKGVDVQRVTFNAITERAVRDAFEHPRALDDSLVQAYLARRALDYLVGFTLSPILWRKLPGSRSAGRVQSVALRLVCEREQEIEAFRPREYWSVEAILANAAGDEFKARLTHLDGTKLDRFDIADEAAAKAAAAKIEAAAKLAVAEIERKRTKRHPSPPFTTSTLQQEASRKLGLGASQTMRVAQRLYEGVDLGGETVGLITYMRTDGVQIDDDALGQVRRLIRTDYGEEMLPGKPRMYKSPAKNAQEAHEAIRPTDLFRRPKDMAPYLDGDQNRLYELIWKRAVASQMESAEIDQVAVDIDGDGVRLRANGSTIAFEGFLRLYRAGVDDAEDDDERRLPPLSERDELDRRQVVPEQHFTQPPPRFTEASLVKRLEELGIGRPSTYASILQVLQDRDYVRLEKKRFVPEDRGRIVTAFLVGFFDHYVQVGFTADMEGKLDEISAGRAEWRRVLAEFWADFKGAVDEIKDLRISEVIDALDEALGPHFFPTDPEQPDIDPRRCPRCGDGRMGLRLGKSGGFIGCSNYPECRYTRQLAVVAPGEAEAEADGPKVLGEDPETGQSVSLRNGPFGPYIQLGEEAKPKRVSLPKGKSPDEIDLDIALKLLALPRTLGIHESEEISAGIGRYGPYVKRGRIYKSVPADEDVLVIGLNRAVALLAEAANRPSGRKLGLHPEDAEPVTLLSGRYGPYVKHGRLNASIPKGADPDAVTLQDAVAYLAAQAEKKKANGGKPAARGSAAKADKKPADRKPADKKSADKKSADKKPAARKTTARQSPPRKSAAKADS